MSIYHIIVIILALVAGLLMIWRIPAVGAADKVNQPAKNVSIIIPAYNEEKRLPHLLKSLHSQDFQPHQVLVVDDFSDDRTAELAREYGAAVINSLGVSEKWIGKSRACWSGALAATGDIFMFMDADVRFMKSDSLRRLVACYENAGASGILSVQPYHEVKKPYENLSAIFNIILIAGMNVFTPLAEKLKSAGAFGPCIICDKCEYFQLGGHEAVHSAVMDDLELGQSFQKAGKPVKCYGGRNLLGFRMYPEGLTALFEGWSKNFGAAAKLTHPAIFIMITIWIAGGITAPAFLVWQSVKAEPQSYLLVSIALYIAFCLLMIWQSRRVGNFNLLSLLLFPIHFLFFTGLFIYSLIRTKIFRSVSWRGRKIDV